jgi:hypothetical protein
MNLVRPDSCRAVFFETGGNGGAQTPHHAQADSAKVLIIGKSTPTVRVSRASRAAGVVLFLASDAADSITISSKLCVLA